MSSTDVQATPAATIGFFAKLTGSAEPSATDETKVSAFDAVMPESARGKERFIPVTRFALLDRLTAPTAWPAGQAKEARRFFRYLDHWRRQQYNAQLHELEETYEPFSPDSDLLMTRAFTPDERAVMQARVIDGMTRILNQANYVRIDHNDVEQILTRESAYGLDLQVDLDVFEEVLLFYRGASSKRDARRRWQKFYLREQIDIPLFQRLFLLFKLKPVEKRVQEVMRIQKLSRREAEKIVKREREGMPPEVKETCIYMKLFKNIPRSDLEMIFPNTRVRFRFFDKLRLGATAGGGLGLGVFGAAGKIALLATNPIAALGALVGLGGIAFRQSVNFMNQKQRYMVVMAQNLYFHAMADNRGVMLKLGRSRRRGGHQGRDAALQRADQGARSAPGHSRHRCGDRAVPCRQLWRQRRLRHHRRARPAHRRRPRRRASGWEAGDAAAEGSCAAHRSQVGRVPRRAAGAHQRRGHGVRRRHHDRERRMRRQRLRNGAAPR